MRITVAVQMNLRVPGAISQVEKASGAGVKDTVIDIARDVVRDSPWLTGNNARSVDYSVDGMAGMVFSTSGYGGWLETGTAKMDARPYFRPSAERHLPELPGNIRRHMP